MLGVMIDCSRNAVMNVRIVKKFTDLLVTMGYDTLMLYTEDTYEVNNQPMFGYKRGRYSKAEMKELDAYCKEKGIELVPCIQTLAHMNCIFKWWDSYACVKDWDDILMVGTEKTYELIEDMIATLAECFTSRRIHIGMDEAYMVGLGNYLKKHEYEERFELINRHLHRVCEITEKYGFRPMIWSDMFCKLALDNVDHELISQIETIRRKAALPDNISLVYWNYYSKRCDEYQKMLKINQAFDREVVFAGGAWTWKGFIPDNKLSMEVMAPAIQVCNEYGIENIFFTMWGDDGGECSRFSALPALFYAAQIYQGNRDENSIKERFKEFFGVEFDTFLLFEELNFSVDDRDAFKAGASKYLLYNDPFSAVVDYKVTGTENNYYRELKCKLENVAVPEEFQLYFDYAITLCDVLSVKSELGVHTRSAYLSGDKERIRRIAETVYVDAINKVKCFHKIYQKWWMFENKPQGFDIQDIRIGGLLQRLKSCRERLLSYCEGIIERIPELEEEVIPAEHALTWAGVATTNVVSHIYF